MSYDRKQEWHICHLNYIFNHDRQQVELVRFNSGSQNISCLSNTLNSETKLNHLRISQNECL